MRSIRQTLALELCGLPSRVVTHAEHLYPASSFQASPVMTTITSDTSNCRSRPMQNNKLSLSECWNVPLRLCSVDAVVSHVLPCLLWTRALLSIARRPRSHVSCFSVSPSGARDDFRCIGHNLITVMPYISAYLLRLL